MHKRDELTAHGHDSLHAKPMLLDEHVETVSLFELHDSTALRNSAESNAKKIANLKLDIS